MLDPADWALPDAGLVHVRDPETSNLTLMDTSAQYFRNEYEKSVLENIEKSKRRLERAGARVLELQTDKPFMPSLVKYFTLRQPKRAQLKV